MLSDVRILGGDSAGVSSYFKPTVFDRVDFLENTVLPILERVQK